EARDLARGALAEVGAAVQAGADRGAAERELREVIESRLDVAPRVAELRRVAREFLAERERGRVLQVRAADLHDVCEGGAFRRERGMKLLERRQEAPANRD